MHNRVCFIGDSFVLQCLDISEELLENRIVDFVDIVNDPVSEHRYKSSEDLTKVQSKNTGRGPLSSDWLEGAEPVMTSYKSVSVKLDLWGFQSRLEDYVHKSIREVLLVGHRQAVAWLDDWYGMSIEEVRQFESRMQQETNQRLLQDLVDSPLTPATPSEKKGWFSWS